jgi:hypothetical protein
MVPGNVDLIRPIYEEFSRGNFRLTFDVYHPHMEWGWSDEFPGLDGVYDDRRDPNPRLRTWLSAWEDWRLEIFADREKAIESVRVAESKDSDQVS